jgi:hypothetical protein
MIASWLAVLLLVAPARAATSRVDVDAAAVVPRVTPLSAPLSAPVPSLTAAPGLSFAPSAQAAFAPSAAPALSAAPLAAALPAPALLPAPVLAPAAAPALSASPLQAASDGPGARGDAESAKRPADEPTPSGRIRRMLRALANPFGTKTAESAPPPSEAVRLDRAFSERDVWTEIAPAARAEIERLRNEKTSKEALAAYVRAQADAATARILAARGVKNLGFHYNLHGGRREDYVGAGINATMGDIALQYTMSGDRNYKVYFFQTEKYRLYDILNESHPQILLFSSRMGNALNVFDVNAPALEAARADGRIKNDGQISMDFHGMRGVPYSAYLAPPLEVFTNAGKKKLGLGKLSRDEETLATVRYLEAALVAGGAYVPKN